MIDRIHQKDEMALYRLEREREKVGSPCVRQILCIDGILVLKRILILCPLET